MRNSFTQGVFSDSSEWLLTKLFSQDEYVMTYFHPRDFDPDQPMVPGLGLIRYFKSYVGLDSALWKLDAILAENQFLSLDEADEIIDWSNVPSVKVS